MNHERDEALTPAAAGAGSSGASSAAASPLDAALAKAEFRLVPFLFLCNILCFIDRTNIGIAKLQMAADIGLGDVAYGVAATIFFVGYILFEIPSNLMFVRIGVRKTILRIMLLWGITSAASMSVSTPGQFAVARFLLGVFEAGYFPAVALYLTYWFPSRRRARIMSLFFTSVVVSNIIGSPFSGWLLTHMDGVFGWRGWQWMFLIEGLPSTLAGIVAYFYLDERPTDARWLSAEEKRLIANAVEEEHRTSQVARSGSFGEALRDRRVFVLCFCLFTSVSGGYALSLWGPTLIHSAGINDTFTIGLYAALPNIVGLVSMIVVGYHSDAVRERRWHYSICSIIGAAGLVLGAAAATTVNVPLAMFGMSVAVGGLISALPVFWAIPPRILTPAAAAGALALINSAGVLGGVLAPLAVGIIKAHTQSPWSGFYLIAAFVVVGALAIPFGISRDDLRETA